MRDMDGREVNALIIQEPMQRRVFDCRDRCGERDGPGVCYFANGCFGSRDGVYRPRCFGMKEKAMVIM